MDEDDEAEAAAAAEAAANWAWLKFINTMAAVHSDMTGVAALSEEELQGE